MNPAWLFAALGFAMCVVAALWPLTPALSGTDTLQVRAAAGAIAASACAILALSRHLRPTLLVAFAVASAAGGTALLWVHFDAAAECLADYDGRPVLIGRDFLPDAAAYLKDNPGLSQSDRLLDAGGDAARIWTAASIRSCRLWVSWGGLAAIPLFALCVGSLIARSRHRFAVTPRKPPAATPAASVGAAVYDAFLSYRHTEPDQSHALELLAELEAHGLRAAIDIRDFAPNEHFLSETERCIKQSRFVLCIVTSRYLASDHTSEEAIISKALDLADRRRRLLPLIFERVVLPIWLHGLVGIDFTPEARVDPSHRLLELLMRDREE